MSKVKFMFNAPCTMPNGLQGTEEGMWIIDQLMDDAFLVDKNGRLLRHLKTESENSSGIAYGGGALWLAANAVDKPRREERPTDRKGKYVLKVDPKTGETLEAHSIDGLGGVIGGLHGLEWVEGSLWIARPGAKVIQRVDARSFKLTQTMSLPLPVSHGLAWEKGAIWRSYRVDHVLIRHDAKDGSELERIDVPSPPNPEVHGLTIWNGDLIYCDATSPQRGRVVRVIR